MQEGLKTHEYTEEEKRLFTFEMKLVENNNQFMENNLRRIIGEVIGEHESNSKRIDNIDDQLLAIPIRKGSKLYLIPIISILSLCIAVICLIRIK